MRAVKSVESFLLCNTQPLTSNHIILDNTCRFYGVPRLNAITLQREEMTIAERIYFWK